MTTERQLSSATIADLQRSSSPNAYLGFMHIHHTALNEDIRVVSDAIDYNWNGYFWKGIFFEPVPVTDSDAPPSVDLRFQNIDRRIGMALRRAQGRAKVSLYVLSSADFDLSVEPRNPLGTPEVMYSHMNFELVDVDHNPVEITGRLQLRDYSGEPFGRDITAKDFPGLFA